MRLRAGNGNRLNIGSARRCPGSAWLVLAACAAFGHASSGASNALSQAVAPHIDRTTFVFFDTETTGLNARKDRIVEIGAVKLRAGRILEQHSWLIDPGVPIPARVQKIHGITPEMVRDAPAFCDVFREFARFAADAVLVAHNARFDIRFLNAELERCGSRIPGNVIFDSLPLFRNWFPGRKRYGLRDLAARAGLPVSTTHRALADAEMVARLFREGLNKQPSDPALHEILRSAGGALRLGPAQQTPSP